MRPSHLLLAAALLPAAASSARAASVYDQAVQSLRPVMFLDLAAASGTEPDKSGNGHAGRYVNGTPGVSYLPNGERAALFNGAQYLTIPSSPKLSVPTKGSLTVVAWIKPSTLNFARTENEDFVYILGKGNPSDGYEYANRMYSYNNSAGRPNRISCYHWNPNGGLGSGSYFQDKVRAGEWIMITDVIDMRKVDIYKNGVLRDSTPQSQYSVVPRATNAPFNVGTRNFNSWFQGAVGKVAVFDRALSPAEIRSLYAAMGGTAAPLPDAPGAPLADGPASQAPQRFLSPALRDGVNDSAVFGDGAQEVEIVDVRGREVFRAARVGGAPIVWDGRDDSGQVVESGVYVAKIKDAARGMVYQSFAIVK